MGKKIHWIYSSIILLLLLAWVGYASFYKPTRIAYVDLPRVFAGFELKKDLEKRLQSEVTQKNQLLDSMKLALGVLPRTNEADFQQIAYGKQNILQAEESIQRDNAIKAKQFDEQIFARLNAYMKEYAAEEGYDFILGAEGSGLIMAAGEKMDVTDGVIEYVNRKYKGQ